MELDGVATRGKSLAEVTRMLCGAVGSYATIKLFRFPQNGAPFFVETTLLRLPVLSEELRASMYPKYNASRKVFAEAQSSAGTTKTATPSSQIVQSPPSAAAAAAAPAPAAAAAPAPAPAPAPASKAESNVTSAMTTNVSQSKAVSLQMESIHVWTKESLTQVWHAAFITCRVFSPS
jgi:biotin carboxyl carrier protein